MTSTKTKLSFEEAAQLLPRAIVNEVEGILTCQEINNWQAWFNDPSEWNDLRHRLASAYVAMEGLMAAAEKVQREGKFGR
jgi:hypothetical protein